MLGGAASGKSGFSEQLVTSLKVPKFYLATAQAFDDEMSAKIAAHRDARADQGWLTIEEPLQADRVLAEMEAGSAVLLDCATFWLSNTILAEKDPEQAIDTLVAAVTSCAASVAIVTNEVGQGIVPEAALGRAFRTWQGRLNIALAANCDLVVQVIAGLPVVLKGHLPKDVT